MFTFNMNHQMVKKQSDNLSERIVKELQSCVIYNRVWGHFDQHSDLNVTLNNSVTSRCSFGLLKV